MWLSQLAERPGSPSAHSIQSRLNCCSASEDNRVKEDGKGTDTSPGKEQTACEAVTRTGDHGGVVGSAADEGGNRGIDVNTGM